MIDYILNTNDQARERLNLQHALYAKNSIQALNITGGLKNKSGLEIGCGSGAMTIEIAKCIGPQGQLLAIDLSEEQTNYAKNVTKDYNNIRFKVWDVNHLVDLGEQFDFIYCRLVLHHLADAHSTILQMKACLKPGGIVICEEPSLFDSTFCYPKSKSYEQYTQWVRTCFAKSGKDFEIAHRIDHEFELCGFKILDYSLFQPLLRTTPEKQMYARALEDLAPQLKALHIATEDEINQLKDSLYQLAESKSTLTWIRMHQVIAQI